MTPDNTTPPASPFVTALARALNGIEIVALAGAAVGLVMRYLAFPGALEILMIAMSVLAMVFFLRGYQPQGTNSNGPRPGFADLLAITIVPKAGWTGCCVMIVGILFSLLGLKGSQEMLLIGSLVLTAVLAIVGMFAIIKPYRLSGLTPLLYRAVPVWLAGLYLYLQ